MKFTSLDGEPVLFNMDAAGTIGPAVQDDFTVAVPPPSSLSDWIVIDGRIVKGSMECLMIDLSAAVMS